MELKKIGMWYGGVSDYDSTKANFDELERRINTLMGSITALEAKDAPWSYKDCPWLPGEPKVKKCEWSIDTDGRIECPWKDCAKYPCKLDLKDGPASFICYGKVDAPERCQFEDCQYHDKCALPPRHRHGCFEQRTSPTCGNCKKAWRRDKDKGLVLCDYDLLPRHKANGVPACKHHERREEA